MRTEFGLTKTQLLATFLILSFLTELQKMFFWLLKPETQAETKTVGGAKGNGNCYCSKYNAQERLFMFLEMNLP